MGYFSYCLLNETETARCLAILVKSHDYFTYISAFRAELINLFLSRVEGQVPHV